MIAEDALLRRLFISDAIALLCATGVGFSIIRALWDSFLGAYGYRPVSGWTTQAILGRIPFALLVLMPLLTTWTLTVLLLGLRQPRPLLRHLPLQSGFSSCAAALLVVTMVHLRFAARYAIEFTYQGYVIDPAASSCEAFFFIEFAPSTFAVVCAIVAVWITLAITRLGHAESTWIDRLGRVLGVLWICSAGCQWWFEVHRELYG